MAPAFFKSVLSSPEWSKLERSLPPPWHCPSINILGTVDSPVLAPMYSWITLALGSPSMSLNRTESPKLRYDFRMFCREMENAYNGEAFRISTNAIVSKNTYTYYIRKKSVVPMICHNDYHFSNKITCTYSC